MIVENCNFLSGNAIYLIACNDLYNFTFLLLYSLYHHAQCATSTFATSTFVLSVKTKGMVSNSQSGNTPSLLPDDLVHICGPITEDAVVGVLQKRSVAGENYVCLINLFNCCKCLSHCNPIIMTLCAEVLTNSTFNLVLGQSLTVFRLKVAEHSFQEPMPNSP